MIAYKAFEKGLRCRGYQFQMGKNVTEKAKTAAYGFHCAENPLDCLSYYGNMNSAEYYVVNAGGDVDEDGYDSKISCTELTIIKKLSKEDFVLHALAWMVDHPKRAVNGRVARDKGISDCSGNGFVIVRGKDPLARGEKGHILAFAKEDDSGRIIEAGIAVVDGQRVQAGKWYSADLMERVVSE